VAVVRAGWEWAALGCFVWVAVQGWLVWASGPAGCLVAWNSCGHRCVCVYLLVGTGEPSSLAWLALAIGWCSLCHARNGARYWTVNLGACGGTVGCGDVGWWVGEPKLFGCAQVGRLWGAVSRHRVMGGWGGC